MMAKANLDGDVHLATTQDGVLRKGNDDQGLRLSPTAWGKKGQKKIHAFKHQSRSGFLFKCTAAKRDRLSPEQGSPMTA